MKRLNRNDLSENNQHNTSSSSSNNSESQKKRRSRTVPTTPKHNLNQTDDKMVNTTTTTTNKSYWEGPPAHFMLPTHADHCRSSRSVERCPRASKGKTSLKLNGMICHARVC